MIARALRHVVIAPLFLLVVVAVVLLSPLLLGLTALLSLAIDRHWRPVRAMGFVIVYGVVDAAAVLAGFGLWLRLGGVGAMTTEAMQTRHYRLITWLFARLSNTARRLLGVRVAVEGDEAEAALRNHDRPLIVLSRHAGPGDSFLLVHELLTRGRRPRIVLRSALQLDPCIDLLGNRLPFYFVTKTGGGSAAATDSIARIAAGMDERSALLLFPEGGNFTKQRRRGSIRHLLAHGLRRRARQAADMRHLIAPRPGGVLAALAGATTADVIFVAHSGLAGLDAHLWERVPTDKTLSVKLWLAPRDHVPATEEARIEWLFDWWLRIDSWVDGGGH